MTTVVHVDDIDWQDHPTETGVEFKPVPQFPEHELRVRIDRVAQGGVAEHSHPHGHLFLIFKGRGTMWVEDVGNVDLAPGILVSIDPHLKHRVFDVREALEFLSVAILPGR